MQPKLYRTLPDEAKVIRQQVFVEEQKFHNEFDEIDGTALHLVMYEGEQAIATGRMYAEEGIAHIGRIAVLPAYRGQHIGAMVVHRLEEEARAMGFSTVALSAQCRVQTFYEKMGYTAMGDIYLDEYCDHIHMEKTLS